MLYAFDVSVPANTIRPAYVSETVLLAKGTVTEIKMVYPWGCAGLVGVKVFHQTVQVYPREGGAWIIGNDYVHVFTDAILLDTEPYQLEVRIYNEDDTYEHTISFTVQEASFTENPRLLQFLQSLGLGR